MRRPTSVAAVLCCLVTLAPRSFAGNNDGGTARLSWDRDSLVTDLPVAPSQRVPLYVLIEDAPDITALVVTLQWSPDDLVGPCYSVGSDSTLDSQCGWAGAPKPVGTALNDSLFSHTIRDFAPSTPCFYFMVYGHGCQALPADFRIAYAITKDSNGILDSLAITGAATILGGAPDTLAAHRARMTPPRPRPLALQAATQTKGYIRPSNAGVGYRQIDLFTNRVASQIADNIGHTEWPATVNNERLIVVNAASDTVAMIRSAGHEGGVGFDDGSASFVTYTLATPQYVTGVALLAMGGKTFQGYSGFEDVGRVLLTITCTFASGTPYIKQLIVGTHIRNWKSGEIQCPGAYSQSFFVGAPIDNAVTTNVISGDAGFNSYFDAQHIQIPSDRWSKKLISIKLSQSTIERPGACAPGYNATSGVFGLCVWPDVSLGDGVGAAVTYKSQEINEEFGGYMIDGVLYGKRRTYSGAACAVVSAAMVISNKVQPVSPQEINDYLRNHDGYARERLITIKTVSGSTLTVSGSAGARVGDTFVVEEVGALRVPIAKCTITQIATVDGKRFPRVATVTWLKTGATITTAMRGYIYWNADMGVLAAMFHNKFGIADAYSANAVETDLVKGIPVMLLTHNSGKEGHWVVADGWKPMIKIVEEVPTSYGTYTVKDPKWGIPRLDLSYFKNEFKVARRLNLRNTGTPAESAAAAAINTRRLRLIANGPLTLRIVDPNGNTMLYDAFDDSYVSSIDGASGYSQTSGPCDDEDGEPPIEPDMSNHLEFVDPVPGIYHITVLEYGEGEAFLSASASDQAGESDADDFDVPTMPGSAIAVTLTYDASEGTVAFGSPTTTSVEGRAIEQQLTLRVLGNPGRGAVRLAILGSTQEGARLRVFDLSGREIDEIPVKVSTGDQLIEWRPSDVGASSGVYFARLRSRHATTAVRFVVLQ